MTKDRQIVLNFVASYGSIQAKQAGSVRVGNRVVLRVVDGDGGDGLMAVEMVKYTARG